MDRIVLVDLQEIQRHLHVFSLLPCLEGFLIPGQGSKKNNMALVMQGLQKTMFYTEKIVWVFMAKMDK
jgi:hypothetical protein